MSELQKNGDFLVRQMPCIITGEFDKCVFVKLQELVVEDKNVDICGQFSVAGLQKLIDVIQSAPDPRPLPDQDEVYRATPYQWFVVYKDGRTLQQFQDGQEFHGGDADFCNADAIEQVWIVPKEPEATVPTYGLTREHGFVRVKENGGELEPLGLPFPSGVPFHWHYYRRVFKTFGMGGWGQNELPVRVVQVLGWRVDTLNNGRDQDTTFEIGVDSDGEFQIWKKQPLDDPLFEEEATAGRIVATNGVRIVDPIGV